MEGSKVKEIGKGNKCSEVVRKIENRLIKEGAKKEVKSKEKCEFERMQEMFGGAKGPMNCKRKISENEGGKVKQAVTKLRQEVKKVTGTGIKRKISESEVVGDGGGDIKRKVCRKEWTDKETYRGDQNF